ncbi:MAG TPA: iron chelate uptake ABC transporter family permease subunit [Verrucomicrobiota bacterium]|nr:iron chelate uptake ABC transporter family permease subunit [Verrucomicrobiota bacterium]HNU52054.1 iron chelate uptake ABC transporter family permease subunit [Verrucomicrobiota bacterium]
MEVAWNLMKWPLLACLLLPGILVYYGLHIVRREIIFVDLALAQVAALGTCLAILMGHHVHQWQTFAWGIAFTLVGAVLFTVTRRRNPRVPQEALIGIVYVVAAAAGLLLLSQNPEGDEQLKRTLVGEVLLVRPRDVITAFGLFTGVGLIHYACRKRFLLISFDPDRAAAAGVRIGWWDLAFYVLFGLVVTLFVQIGGVLLTFSYLIIPAVSASYLVPRSLAGRLWTAWAIAVLGGGLGAAASYRLDLPTGAAIVCSLGLLLVVSAGLGTLRSRRGQRPAAGSPRTPAPKPAEDRAPAGNDAAHPRHWYRITGLRGWERAELGIPAFGEPHCVPQASPGIFQRLRRALRRWPGRRRTPSSTPTTD